MDRSGGRDGGGVGSAITNTLRSSALGGGKPEGVVIETEGGKTFKSRRVVNHVKSCRAAGCYEDRKVSIEFSNNEVIDFGQRGFQPNEEWWLVLWKLKGVGGRGQVWLLCRMGLRGGACLCHWWHLCWERSPENTCKLRGTEVFSEKSYSKCPFSQ